MKKELPDSMKEAMKDIPEGMVAMPFLSPTPKDNITEERVGADTFKVSMDGSFMVVEIKMETDAISITVHEDAVGDEYHLAKLHGYVMCEIAPRFSNDKEVKE
jgi:hypothetical protein